MLANTALAINIILLATAFGATVWFFFVQTPLLLVSTSKEKFLPLQMRLTRQFFRGLAVIVPVMFVVSVIQGSANFWMHVATAGIAAFAVLANRFFVVPRALRAGGKALRDVRGTGEGSTVTDFVSRGGGEASKVWHRLVVVLVVIMLAGLVGHGVAILDLCVPA